MDKFVIYIKDFEAHKKLVASMYNETQAKAFCIFMNNKIQSCDELEDIEDVVHFCLEHGISVSKSDILMVQQCGDYFAYERVPSIYSVDYSYWDAVDQYSFMHNPKFGGYDHYTSDNDYKDCYVSEQDYYEWHFIHELGCWDNLDLKHINVDKLEKLASGNNTYKWFDPEFAHDHILNKFAYGDETELHNFANNHLYKTRHNRVERMVKKYANRDGGYMISKIRFQLVNDILYRKCHIFRMVADRWIDLFEQKETKFYLGKGYTIMNGCIFNARSAQKYLGYTPDECEICGNGVIHHDV